MEENNQQQLEFGTKLMIAVAGLDVVCPDKHREELTSSFETKEEDDSMLDTCLAIHDTKDKIEAIKILCLKYMSFTDLMDFRNWIADSCKSTLKYVMEHPEYKCQKTPEEIIKKLRGEKGEE